MTHPVDKTCREAGCGCAKNLCIDILVHMQMIRHVTIPTQSDNEAGLSVEAGMSHLAIFGTATSSSTRLSKTDC